MAVLFCLFIEMYCIVVTDYTFMYLSLNLHPSFLHLHRVSQVTWEHWDQRGHLA